MGGILVDKSTKSSIGPYLFNTIVLIDMCFNTIFTLNVMTLSYKHGMYIHTGALYRISPP